MTLPFPPHRAGVRPPLTPELLRLLIGVGLVVVLGFFVLPWLAGFATDWLWFGEIGFRSIYRTSLVWRTLLFLGSGVVAFGFLYANLRVAEYHRSILPAVRFVDAPQLALVDALGPIFTKLLMAGAVFAALVTGVSISSLWMTMLMAIHGVSVGTSDPLFGRDIGFYLFRLPAISALLMALVVLTALALVGVALVYGMRGELVLAPKRSSAGSTAARHVGALLAVLFVLTAVQLWFVSSADLLSSTTGPLVGASYADANVSLPGIRLSAITALVAAVLVLWGIARGQFVRSALIGIGLYAGVSILARGIVPEAFERLVVAPNELSRELPYIQNHIVATRKAWGLDNVETHDLSGEGELSMADIRANGATIDNVRLWERDLLKQTFAQLQELRPYYDFVSVNDDRYMIDGKYRQVHIAARELNTASLPTPSFINERLTFTHGMGIAMAPVNQVTDEGLPVLFIKDLPPVSNISITLTRPQIYYGELTNSYVFVGTGQKEFDSPGKDSNTYADYSGRGGVPIGSFLRRALYAWQLGSIKILLSNDLSGSARVLYRRNIAERATTALPFLDFDPEPFLVVNDAGQLKWMLDAYTTSTEYPYSQRIDSDVSYMRNSVKVVIDAYDGTVDAYISDPNDPIVRTYASIFPGVFKPMSAMPADLRFHVRYPGQLFGIQTQLQATYHMTQPESFYHKEDTWQIPSSPTKGQSATPFMRHIIMRLPGETKPEFIYMTPFTPRGKDNLAAWMVARMDGDNYGKLVVYKFPKQSLVYGPKQIANRISQDPGISQQVTLWDQKGSEVIYGELLVIPIEESLIYVQPLYLQAQGGGIPELKRVVVAHEDRVVMAETLEEGLGMLFGEGTQVAMGSRATDSSLSVAAAAPGGRGTIPPRATGTFPAAGVATLLHEAQEDYDAAIAAQRSGNWAEYGKQIDKLGAVLKQLQSGKQ